jgi:hypothetical protein
MFTRRLAALGLVVYNIKVSMFCNSSTTAAREVDVALFIDR